MKVSVQMFAAARQLSGQAVLEIELPPGATLRELRAALAVQAPALGVLLAHLKFAVNTEYAAEETVIPAGAEVACIPPVSGG